MGNKECIKKEVCLFNLITFSSCTLHDDDDGLL